ncbi:MAG TPA: hypothetical protein VFO54_09585 [Chryseosolibacter sp.]|nr:hypothetical protein [Chryseosolibacter sp.]
MADERDLELLDDYLTNRMSEQDRSAFEQKLQADPDLQHEYALQTRVIKGIRDARIAELKSMLNNVPVPHAPGNALATKIAIGTVATLMIAAGAYWFISRDEVTAPETKSDVEQQVTQEDAQPLPDAPPSEPKEEEITTPEDNPVEEQNQTSAGTEQSKPSLAKKPEPLQAPTDRSKEPVLDVFDPGAEEKSPESKTDIQPVLKSGKSSLLVETDRENSRYKFHYQFKEGKLFLYGPFEQNLYEIMEFFTNDKRTVFVYYNDRFYRLEETDTMIRPLEAITDKALLKKLREYRSSK